LFLVEISPKGEFFFQIGENLMFIEFRGHPSFFQKIANFFIKLQHVTKNVRLSFIFICLLSNLAKSLCG
jgi:hypothetical protein